MIQNRQLRRRIRQTRGVPANTYPKPEVTGCSPATGNAAGGTSVQVNGTGFKHLAELAPGDAYRVTFGGADVPSFTVLRETAIAVVTPPHGIGPVDVRVYGPGGQGDKASAFTFV